MSSLVSAGEDRSVWSREKVIAALRRWAALYDASPRASDFNPSAARWSAQEYRIERYRLGDPGTGEPWPALNTIKRLFDGSFNVALAAAGLEVNRPGPPRRSSVDLDRASSGLPPESRVAVEAAAERVRVLEGKLAAAEARLARPVPVPVPGARVVVRERVRPDRAAVDRARRAEASAARARSVASEARSQLSEAKGALAALEARLREAAAENAVLVRRLAVRERELARAREARDEARRKLRSAESRSVEPVVRTERVVEYRERRSVSERELEAARAEARRAEARARAAGEAEARADAAYRELASAVSGVDRRLSAAELRSLRGRGPAGPAVLGSALRDLAAARKAGNGGMDAALLGVARAAVSWREKL